MSATYDPTLAKASDKVRFFIGDTNITAPLFSDEEINALLAIYPDPLVCAAECADALAAKYSRSVSFSVEGLSISNSQKSENYRLLALRLRSRAGSVNQIGLPVVSGVDTGEMRGVQSDHGYVRNKFGVLTPCYLPPELGGE